MKIGKKLAVRWIKFIFSILGFALALFGWFVDNGENIGWIVDTFAREYTHTLRVYERMLDSNLELKSTDEGFAEIVSILAEQVSGPVELISSIRVSGISLITIREKANAGETLDLEVTLQDGTKQTLKGVKDLRPGIRERFLENGLKWGFAIFVVGLVIGLVPALADFFELGDDSEFLAAGQRDSAPPTSPR
jgi:hypothetical protein